MLIAQTVVIRQDFAIKVDIVVSQIKIPNGRWYSTKFLFKSYYLNVLYWKSELF